MAHIGVIRRDVYLPALVAQGASSTAEFQFNDASVTPAARAQLSVPPNWLTNRRFVIRIGGKVTGGTTTNFTVKLYSGVSATIGSNSSMLTSGAIAVNTASGNWVLEAVVMQDSTSSKLQGRFAGHVNATAVAAAATTAISSIVGTAENGFTVTGTFSASDAGNAATLEFFEIEG